MKDKCVQALFDLCVSELTDILSLDSKYEELRKSAYDMEMNLIREFDKEQFEKIKTLLEEIGKISLAESECLFEMAFYLGIRIAINSLK